MSAALRGGIPAERLVPGIRTRSRRAPLKVAPGECRSCPNIAPKVLTFLRRSGVSAEFLPVLADLAHVLANIGQRWANFGQHGSTLAT